MHARLSIVLRRIGHIFEFPLTSALPVSQKKKLINYFHFLLVGLTWTHKTEIEHYSCLYHSLVRRKMVNATKLLVFHKSLYNHFSFDDSYECEKKNTHQIMKLRDMQTHIISLVVFIVHNWRQHKLTKDSMKLLRHKQNTINCYLSRSTNTHTTGK